MKETRLGEFEEVIMLLVGILGEDHSYALRIAEEFKAQTGRGLSIGAVHSTLTRLEDKGFLYSEMSKPTSERGGRRKRIYKITAYGKKVLFEARDFKMALWKQYPAFSFDSLHFGI
jgi:PadR family transcriptional regulator, regulatory protein PadR